MPIYPMPRVLREIFGSGCPARFNCALPKQVAKDALLAALKSPDEIKAETCLIGEITKDDLRIKCIIPRDGTVRRDYTTFVGSIRETDSGCEVTGFYVVPLRGKVLMAVIVAVAFVFAVTDLISCINSDASAAQWLRGPIVFALTVGLTSYWLGVNREQIDEISDGIRQALGLDRTIHRQ